MALTVDHLTCGYRNRPVLRDINFTVEPGEVLCLLGRNGVGKTTLFRTIMGFLPPLGGTIRIDGTAARDLGRRDLARRIGYVPQSGGDVFNFAVSDVVLLGRTAWLGLRGSPTHRDRDIAADALHRLGLTDLADANFLELSGGQRQMVLIARALAQQPELLMMDEPTANLDLGNEARVLNCVAELAADGMAIVMTSHNPQHAFTCATTAALFQPGGDHHIGPVDEVLTALAMRDAYDVELLVTAIPTPEHGLVTTCTPLGHRKPGPR
ncbi:ABC transporter ATP-binding protein [Rhodococcus sp. T2V]|uniref:ABC transporter ATP-binding protein n=1 Tax=Rhodococcus sp. T2V TaxID=3034164 RepID=UPI0023E2F6FB|nr:ABC transporter ATP-binding protein [Rhodococcus sp. T2V]MDF3312211.1 ABC transporter ATP-binding protein [Rhodococcus sp. T2V]